jgi:hypothetical protein
MVLGERCPLAKASDREIHVDSTVFWLAEMANLLEGSIF